MKFLLTLIITLFLNINSSFAKLTTIEVTTEGTGTTKQLAILDGLKNAITQVNGAVLGLVQLFQYQKFHLLRIKTLL